MMTWCSFNLRTKLSRCVHPVLERKGAFTGYLFDSLKHNSMAEGLRRNIKEQTDPQQQFAVLIKSILDCL